MRSSSGEGKGRGLKQSQPGWKPEKSSSSEGHQGKGNSWWEQGGWEQEWQQPWWHLPTWEEEWETGGLKESQRSGKGKKGEKKGKGKGKSKKGKGKGQQVDPLDETRHQELKEQEESQGFDPSLQESRGRRHRHWRTERRKKDPEVQQKKEEYEKSGQWPETRPEPLKEGSQRWNRMKELEKEFIEERRNLQERKQRQLEEETKMNQRLMDKLEEVQEMQRRQQELWERGLKQSQRSSSEEAETPLILKEGPGASSKWRSPSAERLREKCLQEKKEKEKAGLKLETKEKAEPSPLDEEDEKSESSSKESASKDSKPKTVDPNDL